MRAFDAKWIRGPGGSEAEFLGTGDIQSLADLTNAVEVVRTMTVVPISKQGVGQLTLVTLAPLVPLVLTLMSLEELVKTAMGMLS